MKKREALIASTFIDIAQHLVDNFDVVDTLSSLAERCAHFVEAAEVGFLLADSSEALQVVGSSSERMHQLELFELQVSEGPCLDCYRSGAALLNVDVDAASKRWPRLDQVFRNTGIKYVHALPMRLRSETIGAVNLFHAHERTLDTEEAAVLQAFADAATITIIQERALRDAEQLAEQLQHALQSRVLIEQAKGVLAERLQIGIDDAFRLMRRYARSANRHLHDVAGAITAKELPMEPFTALLREGPGT